MKDDIENNKNMAEKFIATVNGVVVMWVMPLENLLEFEEVQISVRGKSIKTYEL